MKVSRRAWQGREIPVEDEAWNVLASAGSLPDDEAEQSELLGAIRDGIPTALTPHQRSVLVALALNDVPIDVLAERLQTTRGALYKSLHDARRSLRRHLAADGLRGGRAEERSDVATGSRCTNRCDRLRSGRPARRSAARRASSCSTATSSWRSKAPTPTRRFPGLRAHLEGCPACREEHESLLALVSSDEG